MRQASRRWFQAVRIELVVLAALVVVWAGGCERAKQKETGGQEVEETSTVPSHPAVDTAEAYLEAVKYRDLDRAWKNHVESTREGVYCTSDAFKRVLERTRKQKTERDCKDAAKVGPGRRAALGRDAQLLLQILRFACEQPDGSCVDYAKRVFTSQMPKTSLWKKLGEYEIRRFKREAGGDDASIYVDFWRGEREGAKVYHRTLELMRREGRWYVTSELEREGGRHLPDVDAVR